jgi:uncharacterized membrane protein
LPHPEPPEIALQAGTGLVIPLWVRNQTGSARDITLTVNLPSGWTVQSGAGKINVAAQQIGAARVEVKLPALAEGAQAKPEPQQVSVRAESNGQTVGEVKLRVELRKRALPE